MQISKKQNGDLNAVVTIEISPDDYKSKYDDTIRKYSKNASMPGFRPGHVPAGMIKKMYGKSVLADVLNDLLNSNLYKFIEENKIDMLGMPLPLESNQNSDIEIGNSFKFDYEIGIAPNVEVKLPSAKVPYYLLKIDQKMVDTDIADIRRKYGKFSNPEAAETDSILYGEFKELDENGDEKAGGNSTTTTLAIDMIRDEEEKAKFTGVKKDETVKFNPRKAVGNETELKAMLRLEKDSGALESDYSFNVKTVNKIEKAELNQELFDKVLGEGIVTSEDEFLSKIRESLANHFERDSDRKMKKDLRMKMLEENSFQLPDDFLKRMLRTRQEEKISDHDFDHQYLHAAEDLRWQIISKNIAKENDLTVTADETEHAASMMIAQQFAQYGMPPPEEPKLKEMTLDYLRKDNNYERLSQTILDDKVFKVLKEKVKLDMIEIAYDDFVAKMQEQTEHELEHHHH